MSMSRFARVAAGLLWLAAGFVPVAHADTRYVSREEKNFTVSGAPDVALRTFDGSIEVRTWDKADVHVTIERHAFDEADAKAIEVDARQDGNRIVVEVRKPAGEMFNWFGMRSRRANLIVSVPRSSALSATSGDGSIDVDGVNGKVDLHSGDGSIAASGVKGDLNVSTGDGSIRVQNLDGALQARSGDGSVRADGRLSAVDVRTGDGSVAVTAAAGSAMTGDWNFVTGDGSVRLGLPADFAAEVDAHTGDGAVSIEGLSLKVSGTLRRNAVRGTLGNGGRMLTLRSGDGSITLSSR
jgi:DUF4097 and DUF4098 domain-containing protein YvlB